MRISATLFPGFSNRGGVSVRNLLTATLLSTLVMILSTASPGICSFSEHILWSLEGNGDLRCVGNRPEG